MYRSYQRFSHSFAIENKM